MTKVDFDALNKYMIKPLGVYGSKFEIAHLLQSLKAINDDMRVIFFPFSVLLDDRTLSANLLLAPTDHDGSQPTLSSGLYALSAGKVDDDQDLERHYIIYWPEDSTWNDTATPSVCRNRVTFMRWVF